MSAIHRYCSQCGAANAVESQMCFACQSPLVPSEEGAQDTLLNGRYRLLTQVGAGGFGGVYRALDTAEEPRIVAVKEISLRGLSAREAIEATDGFHREMRLLSDLRHPNLPGIRDSFTDPEHWYLVMDFIEGETLEEYLKRRAGTGLPLEEALAIGLQLCTVLDYLHTREPPIIFRDLKPSNVMRTGERRIYLIDFGIARHFTPGKLKDTAPFGSPGYAAPEQYGRTQTTPQADIYSLGALLHQMLTGKDPAESPFRFSPLPIADSTELAELDALIQRMVATEPAERPATIAEVQEVLQRLADALRARRFLSYLDSTPPAPVWPGPPPAPALRSRVTRRGVIATTLSIIGVVAGVAGLAGTGVVCSYLTRPRFAGTGPVYPPSPGVPQQHLIYRGHKGAITALSWSPDGKMVASGSADKTVQVWRASDGAPLYTLTYDSPVSSLAWASDVPHRIASGGSSDGAIPVWDALHEHTYLIWHGDGRVLALDWQKNSPWIVSGGTDREMYVWNGLTGQRRTSYSGHRGDVRAVMWLPPTPIPASAQTGLEISGPNPTPTPATQSTPAPGPTSTPASTPSPASMPGFHTNLVASGGADGTVQVWDGETGRHLLTYSGHTAGVNGLAIALPYQPDGPVDTIASASDDQTVHLWWLNGSYAQAHDIYQGHTAKVNAVVALPWVNYYGSRFASASDDHTVQVWSQNKIRLFTYSEHRAPVKTLAASPVKNDNRVVSGDENGLVHLWTIEHTGYQ